MTPPKISISVPIYNAENTLRKCLDSLINQTLKDIEIILVDDGSTDSSSSICDQYAKKDNRIVVIHKDNGGSASARQAALDASTGIYIGACDADDWAELNMFELLYNKAIESCADIVMCDYWSEYSNSKQNRYHYRYNIEQRKDLLDDAINGRFPCQVWNKIIKTELFKKHTLSWEKGINLGEDFLLMMKMLQYPLTIMHYPIPLYHYNREMGGLSYTNNITLSTFKQSLFIRKWAQMNFDNILYANGLFKLWLTLAYTGLRVKGGISQSYYSKNVMKNIPFKGFFKYEYPKEKGILIFFTKIFGYNFGKIIYKLLHKYFYH